MKRNLKHDVNVNFWSDKKGKALIVKRAKKNKMGIGEYLRYAVQREADA